MYQEIHPCRASSTYSVKINTSLPMMRECSIFPAGLDIWGQLIVQNLLINFNCISIVYPSFQYRGLPFVSPDCENIICYQILLKQFCSTEHWRCCLLTIRIESKLVNPLPARHSTQTQTGAVFQWVGRADAAAFSSARLWQYVWMARGGAEYWSSPYINH